MEDALKKNNATKKHNILKMEDDLHFFGWLPTLDTEIKVTPRNIIDYRFFEKPTNPNTVLHSRTAMAEDSKVRSLTNEVIRRMLPPAGPPLRR